jgi:hypothetical protein
MRSSRRCEVAELTSLRCARPISALAIGEVLALAARESRILLTFDKDFGFLAKFGQEPLPAGVVLFRFPLSKPRKSPPRWRTSSLAAMTGKDS